MAVLYSVFQLDAQLEAFVARARVAAPQEPWRSRLPTPIELSAALHSLPGAQVECVNGPGLQLRSLSLTLPGPEGAARLTVNRYAGEEAPCNFYFEEGSLRVALEVLVRVTLYTVPLVLVLVLVPDADGVPIVVEPHLTIAAELAVRGLSEKRTSPVPLKTHAYEYAEGA
jgi:hypothetical protein